MKLETPIIRPMVSEDVASLVSIHRETFAATLGVRLGKAYIQSFLGWFIRSKESLAIVSESNNLIQGYLIGGPAGHGKQLNRDLFPSIIGGLLSHPSIFFDSRLYLKIPQRVLMITKPLKYENSSEEGYNLVAIGVNPLSRRQGVAKRLLQYFVQSVWEKNYPSITLDVHFNNEIAKQLYESNGWKVKTELPDAVSYWIQNPNLKSS